MDQKIYQGLLENNKKWVKEKLTQDQDFFKKLSGGQKPPVLWIGCSDSRVPANEIIGAPPGEVFVHRNIANLVVHTDINMLSVLEYAVEVLDVSHIIVCGHYGCGGIRAALVNNSFGLIDNWVRNIKDVIANNKNEFKLLTEDESVNKLVELNVKQQVTNLGKTSILQKAWHKGKKIGVHGWVYSIENGLIKDLCVSIDKKEMIAPEFHFKFE